MPFTPIHQRRGLTMPTKGPNLKTGQRYEFVCLQIDIAGHSKLKDAERTLHEAKERFHKLVTGLVKSHDGLPFKWEGDGGAFLFPSLDGKAFDESVHAAFDILDALPRINDQLQIAHQLSQPLSVRISLDSGMAVYDTNPGLIAGDFLNAFLKHERAVSLVNEVTITQRIHRQIAVPLRERFTEHKHADELGCKIYRSSKARTGAGLPASSDAPVPLKELTEQVKSATTLVELARCIGKAVVQAGYDEAQADHACSQYLERYEQRFAHVKVLGMTEPVELASIYTEVRIVPPQFLRGYRTQEELQELFLRKGRSLTGYDSDRDVPMLGLTVANDEKYQFLNLLGAPGAGKSTFLRYIGWMALQRYRLRQIGQAVPDSTSLSYRFNVLPVLLELRSLTNTSLNFVALIDEELHTNGFPLNFGRAALQAGGLLVLLDGLDEVPADKMDDTIRGIRNLVDQYPDCRYVTSCRTAFYKNYFTRFTDALLTDFTDDQIRNLIENWFRSDRDRELGTATTLWGLLKDPKHQATRELARTPLLATFLCLVYDVRQQLPTNRAELYGDALRILLERWSASKRVHGESVFPGLSTKRELLMLEGIAGPAYEREQYFFTAQQLATAIERFLQSDADGPDTVDGRKVVEEIERKQGLLVQRAHDKYSFSHLTLHEYLAACHYDKTGRSQEIAKATLTKARWREVHLLLAGLEEPDADAFLLAMTTETAEQVTSDRLKGLLSWAERIVRIDPSPKQTAARRAFMMGFGLVLARALTRARDFALDLDRAVDCAIAIAIAIDRAIDRDRDRDRDLFSLGSFVIRHDMITAERSAGFAKACNTFHRYLSTETVQGLENALDFPQPETPFSQSDARQCLEFLTCTQRILECREAAERVTQAGWDRVCERLIALPKPEQGV
jgi:energy-coupling factor transporter ATP-binding protein EcfA2